MGDNKIKAEYNGMKHEQRYQLGKKEKHLNS